MWPVNSGYAGCGWVVLTTAPDLARKLIIEYATE